MRYGPLGTVSEVICYSFCSFSPLSICNFRPYLVNSTAFRSDWYLTCHQDASLRIRPIQCARLNAVWFCFLLPGFLRYALLPLSSSANVLFFQVSQSRRHEYKRRIKKPHFFIILSVFSYSVHGLKCSAGRHLQPLPVGSLTVTFNQLTCWLFSFLSSLVLPQIPPDSITNIREQLK